MTRLRCAKHCCAPFAMPVEAPAWHLCERTGTVDAYVADTAPLVATAVQAEPVRRVLRAVA